MRAEAVNCTVAGVRRAVVGGSPHVRAPAHPTAATPTPAAMAPTNVLDCTFSISLLHGWSRVGRCTWLGAAGRPGLGQQSAPVGHQYAKCDQAGFWIFGAPATF